MRKPRKLTPSQERRLHTALTLDNLLYREFQRLRADLDRDVERLYRMPSRVVEVAAKHGQLLMPLPAAPRRTGITWPGRTLRPSRLSTADPAGFHCRSLDAST